VNHFYTFLHIFWTVAKDFWQISRWQLHSAKQPQDLFGSQWVFCFVSQKHQTLRSCKETWKHINHYFHPRLLLSHLSIILNWRLVNSFTVKHVEFYSYIIWCTVGPWHFHYSVFFWPCSRFYVCKWGERTVLSLIVSEFFWSSSGCECACLYTHQCGGVPGLATGAFRCWDNANNKKLQLLYVLVCVGV